VNLALAANYAGVGFGNAGSTSHALAYPIASLVRDVPSGYRTTHALVPHGVSVVVTAPATFQPYATSPERHLRRRADGSLDRGLSGRDAREALRAPGADARRGIPNGIARSAKPG
jgi:alcohol dehydrogenase class IV